MTRVSPMDRFILRVARSGEGGCWIWCGSRQTNGYGRFSIAHKWVPAHRWSYEQVRGPIPRGLDLDHLCREPLCVNPDHLEAVTRRVNLLRGRTIPAAHAAKTRCPAGHAYDQANTYTYRGMRQCRKCRAVHRAKHRASCAAAGAA